MNFKCWRGCSSVAVIDMICMEGVEVEVGTVNKTRSGKWRVEERWRKAQPHLL